MSRTKVSSIKSYFTKSVNQEASHVWYSCEALTDEEVVSLKEYLVEKAYAVAMFVRNVAPARPLRTGGSLPTWFRPANEYRSFEHCPTAKGDFVFAYFKRDDIFCNEEKIAEFLMNVYNNCLKNQKKHVYIDGKEWNNE